MKNINKKAPVWATKLAAACVTAGSTIAGYGLTASNSIVGYIGLSLAVSGAVLPIFLNGEKNEQN